MSDDENRGRVKCYRCEAVKVPVIKESSIATATCCSNCG